MKTEIVYEDNQVIVCYKPAGLATQTARVGQADVVSELKNYIVNKDVYLGVVHRLDQPVEGLLVFAKTKSAAASLSAQLNKNVLNKHYYAVVCGQPSEKEGILVDYLAKNNENKALVWDKDASDGLIYKKSVLNYRIIESVKVSDTSDDVISLADINIETGRFHQIRAQMSHAGMPLLGDGKYGTGKSEALSMELMVRNVALCAYELEFEHPVSGKRMHFTHIPSAKVFKIFKEISK
jgi:23S rRNA pseudouridine1911/1915/1917 synthase